MSRIVLIIPSATYRATDFMAAAATLGVELIIVSDRRATLQAVMGDRSQVVRFDRPEQAAEQLALLHERLPFEAALGVDDQGVLIAALVAARLGLRHSPPSAVAATRDKARTRSLLSDAGMAQPRFTTVGSGEDVAEALETVGLPCVLKPLGLSASRGVIRADTIAAAEPAAERIRRIIAADTSASHDRILVESYLPGTEVAVEALATGGRVNVLAIFDKPDPLEGPFFEETIYVTPSRLDDDLQEGIAQELQRAATHLGLAEGPIHAEFRIDEGRIVVLELAGRSIGGLCSRALRFGANTSLEELILRHALGLGIDGVIRDRASGVMMIPIPHAGTLRAVQGVDAARELPGIEGVEITVPVGQAVVPLPEGDRYLGFIFAADDTPEKVEDALRKAHRALDLEVAKDEADHN